MDLIDRLFPVKSDDLHKDDIFPLFFSSFLKEKISQFELKNGDLL